MTAAVDVEVAIVGAGFAGLGMAIQLKQRGIDDFVVLERAQQLGGTWRDNTYPGCACDVPSMLYSYSFAPNPAWTRVFPSQAEIWAYLERCADTYGVRPHIRFGAELTEAAYDEESATWRIRLQSGDEIVARVLILALGSLNKPLIPALPGRERFAGRAFHSSLWEHDYDVRGKRIAVIGTGASAIQVVPAIAPQVEHLTLFQRTAPWIIPRPDAPVPPVVAGLLRRVPLLGRLVRTAIYWALEFRALGFTVSSRFLPAQERAARKHLEAQVPEPELRRMLTPDYRIGCKRMLISSDYYPALRRSNVELVTSPIRELREHAVVTEDGREHPVDAIVYGTGFRATDGLGTIRVTGRGGVSLADAWRGGMEAFLGTTVAGFPNLFFLIGPNTGLGHNSMILMMEAQFRYVFSALALLRRRGARALDVKAGVQERFNRGLQRRMRRTVWTSGCHSWYLDAQGKNTTLWPGFTFTFRFLTRRLDPRHYDVLGGVRRGGLAAAPNEGAP